MDEWVIWDVDIQPKELLRGVLWSGYSDSSGLISLMRIIEDDSERLREKLLFKIDQMVSYQVEELRNYYFDEVTKLLVSMSSIVEKSIYKSKTFLDCLKMLLVDEMLNNYKGKQVRYVGLDKNIALNIEILLRDKPITFIWDRSLINSRSRNQKSLIKSAWHSSPPWIRGILELGRVFYQTIHFKIFNLSKQKYISSESSILLMSYFINFDEILMNKGIFSSKYWRTFPRLAYDILGKIEWVHMFVKSKEYPNLYLAQKKINKIQKIEKKTGLHSFLHQHFDIGFFLKIFFSWGKILILTIFFARPRMVARKRNVEWLWQLFHKEWLESLIGSVGVRNLVVYGNFTSLFRKISYKKVGIYLMENQGWERALILAWKNNGHGDLIGFAHSTVRYWDLRYLDQNKLWFFQNLNFIPKPDYIAINGLNAATVLSNANQYDAKYVQVESLRYLNLRNNKFDQHSKRCEKKESIYIFGSIDFFETYALLDLIKEVVPNFKEQFKFLFKPHPACFIDPSLHSPWIALLRYESIEDIATKAYMGIATSSTSASVDAYFMGIPIAIYRNQSDLNSGPLRGSNAVPIFDNAQELIKILNMKYRVGDMNESVNSFFFLDDKLPRWEKLISKYAYS